MFQLGLIGKSLKHSFSADYFRQKFLQEQIQDIQYTLWELDTIQEVLALKNQKGLIGFNVTIPYKEAIIPFLYQIHPVAQAIGAVNCVAVENNHWIGHNTDCIGFRNTLVPHLKKHHQRALVLGNGGAAKAIVHVLKELNLAYSQVGRNGHYDLHFNQLNQTIISTHDIIINCTPIGMYPNESECPLSLEWETNSNQICYDLIYKPTVTQFLKMAESGGSIAINGYEMLRIQAEESWQIWRPLCEY